MPFLHPLTFFDVISSFATMGNKTFFNHWTTEYMRYNEVSCQRMEVLADCMTTEQVAEALSHTNRRKAHGRFF